MNKLKSAARATKNFIVGHKTAIAVLTTASALIWMHRVSIRDYDTFLAANDLNDDFIAYLQDA